MKPRWPVMRVILFGQDLPALARFYAEALGLTILGDANDAGWIELDAGEIRIGLHRGTGSATGAKIVFGAKDVAAAREKLVASGAQAKALVAAAGVELCDFSDPANNRFQLSNRGME